MKKIKFVVLFLIVFQALYTIALANENKINIDNISKNLRCLICQGQSVYDSQSDFAESMKIVIREKLAEGMSEDQIYFYLNQ